MSSFAQPSGPLPRRVYWVRRGVVLAVALLLLFGVVRVLSLLGGGGDDPGPRAATVAAEQDPAADDGPGADGEDDPAGADPAQSDDATDPAQPGKRRTKKPLPKPDGPCDPADVVITPKVDTVFASEAIDLRLVARTEESPACTFDFGADTVSLRIRAKKASGWDPIWTSVHCPSQVPSEELVLRNNRKAKIDFTWWGRRSAEDCVRTVKWALPGTYYLTASALGGEPVEQRFLLDPPKPVYVTEEAKPEKGEKKASKTSQEKQDETQKKKRKKAGDETREESRKKPGKKTADEG